MNSWSYSDYSLALSCLRKYKLVKIDKLASPTVSADLTFGSALHAALYDCISTNGEGAELVFSTYWNLSKDDGKIEYGRFNWEQLNELGLNFVSKFKRLHSKKYKVHTAEKRLYAEYKGIKFEGTPDFIGEYNSQPSVRDFKTSGYNYDKDKRLCALQLNLYTFLAGRELGYKPATLGYTVFNKGTGSIQDLTWDFDETKMYSMLDELVEYISMLKTTKEFPRNPNDCIKGSIVCPFMKECWK